jgi:nucleoside-diphosphate-sugar epimerase
MNQRVCALTGANGYVGSAIRRSLESAGWRVVPLIRHPGPDGISWTLESASGLAGELRARGVTALVHSAWDMNCVKPPEYRRTNLDGSRRLFDEVASAEIRNVVFISTISAFDTAVSLYGRTKLEAEKAASQIHALSIRPGLVWGDSPGGVFGSIEKTVRGASFVPLIGSGDYPQYLVHEDDLGRAIARGLAENWQNGNSGPITIANPQMWKFRDLVLACAARLGRQIKLVSVPWRGVYLALKTAEAAGVRLSFRSDSVLSLVNQNSNPDFSGLERFKIQARAYPRTAA